MLLAVLLKEKKVLCVRGNSAFFGGGSNSALFLKQNIYIFVCVKNKQGTLFESLTSIK